MLRCIASFHAGGRFVAFGDIVSADDPVVAGRESLFSSVAATNVEQATAEPGEKRSVRRGRKTASPASDG